MKKGDRVEVHMHSSVDDTTMWVPGTFIRKVAATDRDHRINVILGRGQEVREAAPECVRPGSSKKTS